VGSSPADSTDIVYKKYLTSLASLSLTEAQVTAKINERFSVIPFALNTYVSTAVSVLGTQSFVDSGNGNGTTTGKVRSFTPAEATSGVRPNGPVALNSSGRIPKNRISVPSAQRWPQAFWSSSHIVANGISSETTVFTVSVNTALTSYKLLVTGTLNAKITADGQQPLVQVRVGSATGPVVASGYGVAESYPGGVATQISSPGSYSYLIPSWCDKLDVVALGGGGGGVNGGFLLSGGGGGAGQWRHVTLTRGTGAGLLPLTTTTLSGVVGAGASNANFNIFGNHGSPGGSTTCSGAGMTTLSAPGGETGANQGSTMQGDSPGNYPPTGKLNGFVYAGGGTAGSNDRTNPAVVGQFPGGGGQGGHFQGSIPGAPGASGAIVFYAYTNDDVNYGQAGIVPKPLSAQSILTSPTTLYVTVSRSGTTGTVTTSTLNPQISVMVVPA
jgi:hypothetical protein